MELKLRSVKDVAVLKSKEWISFNEKADKHVQPGARLVFKVETFLRPKNDKELAYVRSQGTISIDLEDKESIEVGTVSYERDNVKGDALMAYLARHGTPLYVCVSLCRVH